MDACTGLEGQRHSQLQYGTVPGRYYYHEPNYVTDLSDCRPERDPDRALGYWTIPGSRTGRVLQHYTNWRAAMAPPEPFNLDLQLGVHWELEKREGREPMAREEWAGKQRGRKERARRRGEIGAPRVESRSPSRLRRGLPPSWDQNFSYQEPRHWRYSHTLPRNKPLDPPSGAHLQGQLEREERWLHNHALQDPGLTRSRDRKELLGMLREEEGGTATQLTTRFPGTLSFEKARRQESKGELKENQPKKRMFSQPPTYVPPPPYSSPPRTERVPNPRPELSQLDINTAAGRKSPGEWRKEGREKGMEKKKKRLDPEIWPQTLGYGTWGGSTALSKQMPRLGREGPIDRELSGAPQKRFEGGELTTIPDSRRKKSRPGETVFCLVSRPGSVAGGPDKPLEVIPLPKSVTKAGQNSTERVRGRLASEGWEESSRNYTGRESSSHLPHKESHSQTVNQEISGYLKPQAGRDRSQSAERHRSHSHWEEGEQGSRRGASLQRVARERREGFVNYQTLPRVRGPRAKDRAKGRGNTSQNREALDAFEISSKTLTLSGQRGLSGFPRQKEINQLGNPKIAKPKGGETGSCGPMEDAGKLREEGGEAQRDSNNNGVLLIDATCVIVRAEFIYPPKKEHVQYLYLASTDDSGLPDMDQIPSNSSHVLSKDNVETGLQRLESWESKQQITETLSPYEWLLLISRQGQRTPPASETLSGGFETQEAQNLEMMDQVAIPSPVPQIRANETLEKRTRRILGILQEKSRLELEGALCRWEEEGEILGRVTEYDRPRSDNEEQEAQGQEEVEVWERDGKREASGGRDAGERNREASPLGCCESEEDEQERGGGETVLAATGDVETEAANLLGEEPEVQPHRAEEISESLYGEPAFQESENWREGPGSPRGTEEQTEGETTDKPSSPAETPTPDVLPKLDDAHFEAEPAESSLDDTDGIQYTPIEDSPQQETTEGEIPSPEYCQYPPPPPPLPKDFASNSRTLWDAVNRIRKHTAPDSESEDEEVVEVWDRDGEADISVGREAGKKNGEVVHLEGREPGEDEWGRLEGGEEDAFSCSSSDSHTSWDTVITGGPVVSGEEEQGESDAGSDVGERGLGESKGFEIDGDDDSSTDTDAELSPIKEGMGGLRMMVRNWDPFSGDGKLGPTEGVHGGRQSFRCDTGSEWKLVTIEEEQEGGENPEGSREEECGTLSPAADTESVLHQGAQEIKELDHLLDSKGAAAMAADREAGQDSDWVAKEEEGEEQAERGEAGPTEEQEVNPCIEEILRELRETERELFGT
ncbi:uncharacterized protein LOC121308971 [Polyodon spathula]|uniref:uncharacterized protein LOC121308971 n=1 Tax=Polyodon spathula TaxID=7913 RepID=UPI001B7E172D|nr:uncharacterized protein LOC121308971 [Polyodon spathula]XP_041097667.1 uncharacterized protein LOC121308971 [Polyodon spathula]